jgi:hypothetical protein
MNKLKEQLKMLIATPKGWFSWLMANVITSLPWALPLIYGFMFKDNNGYVIAGSIWAFIMLPVTPYWMLNVVIAVFLRNKVFKG